MPIVPGKPAIHPDAVERILEVTRRLATPFDLTTLLGEVIDAARAILHADRGSVFLYEPATDELVTTVATGAGTLRFPATRGIAGECAQTRQVINVPDCYADPRFNPEGDRITGYRTRSLLAVPLIGHDDSLVGVMQVLNKREGVFDEEDQRVAEALAAQCAVALQRMRLLQELVAKERMERELAVARDIQMRVLPTTLPQPPGYDLAGWSRPADETGGDVFDVVPLPDGRIVLLLGDATGHGIGPALSVTQVRSMLRIGLRLGADLDAAFTHINDQLVDDLADNRFVTVFLGVFDAAAHRIVYHSAGQGPLLHFHAATGRCEWAGASTMPMGFMSGLRLTTARAFELAPGDILGLLTDGIYEAENLAEEQFGQARVEALVREHGSGSMQELMARVTAEVDAFREGAAQADDMTMVWVRRLG